MYTRYEGSDLVQLLPSTFTYLPFQDGTKTIPVKFEILNPRVIGLNTLTRDAKVKVKMEQSKLSGSIVMTNTILVCNFTLDSEFESLTGSAVFIKHKIGIDVSFDVNDRKG